MALPPKNPINDSTDGRDQGLVTGTAGDDELWGGASDGQADGGSEIDDTMDGGRGDDTINAGDGDDTLIGGGGADMLLGGDGDDTLYGDGVEGGDTAAPTATNLITNGTFEDGTHTSDGVNGLDGWSNVNGSPDSPDDGTDSEYWNSDLAANDGTGYVTMWASSSSDHQEAMSQTLGTALVAGTDYTFRMQAHGGEYLSGQWFTPSSNPVTLEIVDAATGNVIAEILVEGDTYEPYEVTFTPRTDVGEIILRPKYEGTGSNPSITMDGVELYNTEELEASEAGDDILDGGAGDDIIEGGAGEDTITGGTGDDTISGGHGADDIDGGEDSDTITGGSGDTVDGGEDGDGKDVDVLVVDNVSSIEYRTDAGDITSDVTENGTVTFNDDTTMTFENIENFVVDGEEFTSSTTTPTIDLDYLGGSTPAVPGEAGSAFIALDPATAPIITNDGSNFADDGIAETARYENVATVDGQAIDLIAVVQDAYKLDGSGNDNGQSADATFNVKDPDGNTANLKFDGNSYHKVTWKVVEAGTDIPVVGNFSLLLNDLDGNSGLTSYERVTVDKGDLDSYALDGDTDLVKIETADKITFQPSSNDPGAPGALPENSVQLTFTNTSEFTIEYEKLNSGGNVGLDGEFSSSFFTDPEVVDTNPDFGNLYTEGGSPVTIAASNSNVDSQGACLQELSIKPVAGKFPDGADETLTFPGDGGSSVTVPLDGSDTSVQSLTVGGKDYSVQFNSVSGEIEVKPVSVDEVDDGDIEGILESIVYENAADIDGVSPTVRELEVKVTDIYGTESEPATASIQVVGTDEKLFDLIELDGDAPVAGEQIFSGSEMTQVVEPFSVAQDDPTKLTVGDTIVIDGETFTLTEMSETDDATFTLEDGTEMTGQCATFLTFEGPGGETKTFIAPHDDDGDHPDITTFSFDGPLTDLTSTPVNTFDTDDTVTLATPNGPAIFDAIELASTLPTIGDEQTTLGNDLVAVDEPIQVVGQATPDTLTVGDTIKIGDAFYTVSSLSTVEATVDHDDEFGIPTTSTGVEMKAISLTADDGGAALNYLVPADPEGDLPEITSITTTSAYTTVPTHNIADPGGDDIGSDDVVTLDGAENGTIITDLIIMDLPDNGNPGAGSVPAVNDILSTSGGELVDVVNAATVTHGSFGTDDLIESGDTISINGADYTIDDVQEVIATVSHDDPATGLPIVTTGVEMHNIVLINDAGDFLTVAVPTDGDDLPQITQIKITAVNGAGDEITDTEVDDDDIVTLDTDEVTIHDAIVTAPGVPDQGDVFTTGSNELTSVEEPVKFSLSPDGSIEPGATFNFGGDVYEVTTTKYVQIDVTYDGGTEIADLPAYVIEGTNSDGETVTFTVPHDGPPLPDITEINYGLVLSPTDIEVELTNINGDSNVTLGETGPQIFDAIELSDPNMPGTGEVLTTEGGSGIAGETPADLVSVTEPISVSTQADPTKLQVGDTLTVGGDDLQITGMFNAPVTYTLDPEVMEDVETTFVEVTDTDGNTTIYALPADSEGNLPDIQSMEVGTLTPITEVPFGETDTDDTVTLDAPDGAGPSTFVLHDFVQIDGQPTLGETKTVLDNELLEVDEPIIFTTADPDEIQVGDTTVIDGVSYTVTDTGQWKGTVTLDNGDTPLVKGGLLTLEDSGGGEIHYAMPYDKFGDLPDITEIEFQGLDDDATPDIKQKHIDDNDFVTLICFAAGTHILTNKGEVEVQNLAIGDKVLTRDNGYQKIKWVGKTKVAGRGKFAPVVVQQGTFGNDRDLVVSPQHRVLVCDWRAELMFGEFEVLVPAKHLTTTEGVYTDPRDEIEYVHILFDQHEVIFSEGIPTESFHPGDYSVKGLADETRDELFELFPELAKEGFDYGPSARLSLKRREATQLIEEMGLRPVVMH